LQIGPTRERRAFFTIAFDAKTRAEGDTMSNTITTVSNPITTVSNTITTGGPSISELKQKLFAPSGESTPTFDKSVISTKINDTKSNIFITQDFVCGGHGARQPSFTKFTVPKGINIYFYVHDTKGLPNNKGQLVDQIVNGGSKPSPRYAYRGGMDCWDYHLYPRASGVYLNLAMTSSANKKYITTDDNVNGIALSTIVENIRKSAPYANIHWSACRSLEAEGATFALVKAKYTGAVKILATL
jgi:hypothetical protein